MNGLVCRGRALARGLERGGDAGIGGQCRNWRRGEQRGVFEAQFLEAHASLGGNRARARWVAAGYFFEKITSLLKFPLIFIKPGKRELGLGDRNIPRMPVNEVFIGCGCFGDLVLGVKAGRAAEHCREHECRRTERRAT